MPASPKRGFKRRTAHTGGSAGRRVLTNDELLYDPDADERDQAWVDARRRG